MAPPLHKAIQSPAGFSTSVDAYIAACLVKDDSGKDTLITMAGLSLALACDKESLVRWTEKYGPNSDGDALLHDPDRQIYNALKRAKQHSEQQLQQDCYRNRNAMSLALAKCMYGYVEQQHIKHDVKGSVSISVDFGVPPSEHGS